MAGLFSLFGEAASIRLAPEFSNLISTVGDHVAALARHPSGDIIGAGIFQTAPGEVPAVLVRIGRVAPRMSVLLRADEVGGAILAVAVHPDGRIAVGGDFRAIRGLDRRGMACLYSDGSVDETFDPRAGADGAVRSLAILGDGRILAGGAFRMFDGREVTRIVRVLPNGGIDPEWRKTARPNQAVHALSLGRDGSVYLGGDFTMVEGEVRSYLAKLLPDGGLDRSFALGPGPNAPVRSISVSTAADQKVFVGGFFTDVSGLAWNRIGRLTSTGQPDASFQPGSGASGPVLSTALEEDGSAWIGGAFLRVDGQDTPNIARLDSSGRAIQSVRGYGTDGPVLGLVLADSGLAVLGGEFNSVQGKAKAGLAALRMNRPPQLDAFVIEPSGSRLPTGRPVLFRVEASDRDGEIRGGLVEFSRDGLNFSLLGNLSFGPTSSPTAWSGRLEVASLQQGNYFFRARLEDDDFEVTVGAPLGPVEVVSARDYFGVFQMVSEQLAVVEGQGLLTADIQRTVGTNGVVAIEYKVLGLDAVGGGVDYEGATGTVVFGPGVRNGQITIRLVDDGNYEADERFIIRLGAPDNGAELGGRTETTVVILDDDRPLADARGVLVLEDASIAFRLTGSLTRTNSLTFRIVREPSHGTILPRETQGAGGEFVYLPEPNFSGLDSVDFVVNDGRKDSLPARVSIEVRPINDPPELEMAREIGMVEDQATLEIPVRISDPETPPERLILTAASSNPDLFADGGLSFTGTGALRGLQLKPLPGRSGDAQIRVSLSDGLATVQSSLVVRVVAVNDSPRIGPLDDAEVAEDEIFVSPPLDIGDDETPAALLRLVLLADDSTLLPPDGLRIVDSPAGPRVSLRPAPNRHGSTMVTVQVSDGQAMASTRFRLTVTPVNDAPRAVDDAVGALEGGGSFGVSVGTLVANDFDPDGDPLTFLGVDSETEQGGRLVWNGLQIALTPRPGFSGIDRFRYRIEDTGGLTATGRVEVLVKRRNQPPVALGDTLVTPEDTRLVVPDSVLLANDTDPEGGLLHLVSVAPRSVLGGRIGVAEGQLTYLPPRGATGGDSFTYRVGDAEGLESDATVTIVFGGNPLLARRDVFEGLQDQPVVIPISELLRNDLAADGRTVRFLAVDILTSRGAAVAAVGAFVTYAPPPGFSGSDLFYYQIGDETGLTRFGEVEVKVAAQLAEISVRVLGSPASEFGLRPGRFLLTRRGGKTDASLTVSVNWEGTAAAGRDFEPLPRSVTFEPGQSNVVVMLQPVDDTVREVPAKTVILTLPGASDYRVVEPRRATMGILDDDPLEVLLGNSIRLNLATGLFEQILTLRNLGTEPVGNVRLHLHELESDALVFNAAGSSPNKVPYLDPLTPIQPGETVTVSIQYYLLKALASGAPEPRVVVEYTERGSRITDLHFEDSGELVLVYVAAAARAGRIESTTDFVNWARVHQWTSGSGAGAAFRHSSSPHSTNIFEAFRLIETP